MGDLFDGLGTGRGLLFGGVFLLGAALAVVSGRLARVRVQAYAGGGLQRLPAVSLGPLAAVQAAAAAVGVVLGWLATGLLGMAALLGGLGLLLPPFMAAPARRRRQTAEALAWSLWCRQIAELANAGAGLAESIKSSVEHAPEPVAPIVAKVSAEADVDGLAAALELLASSGSVWEPEVAAGLRMAAASGSGVVGPLLDLSGRIDDVVELHRAKTEAVVQLWIQTIALLALAGGVVLLMYRNNPAYFEPYATSTGQLVLVGISGLLLISVSFLVYNSVVREQNSVLVPPRRRSRARPPL